MTAREFWDVIEGHLAHHGLESLNQLLPGVSDEQLQSAERQMRIRLPRVFANFYRIHDGMSQWEFQCTDENDDSLVGCRIGTLAGAVEAWNFQCEVGSKMTATWGKPNEDKSSEWEQSTEWVAQESADGFSIRTHGVRCEHWHPGRIPFADSNCCDHVLLDLAADDGGKNGQIVDW